MAINPNVREPYQSLAYGAYVEITNDNRFPSVTATQDSFGGTRTSVHPHYALLTKDIDAGSGSGNLPIAAGEVSGYSSINKFDHIIHRPHHPPLLFFLPPRLHPLPQSV